MSGPPAPKAFFVMSNGFQHCEMFEFAMNTLVIDHEQPTAIHTMSGFNEQVLKWASLRNLKTVIHPRVEDVYRDILSKENIGYTAIILNANYSYHLINCKKEKESWHHAIVASLKDNNAQHTVFEAQLVERKFI